VAIFGGKNQGLEKSALETLIFTDLKAVSRGRSKLHAILADKTWGCATFSFLTGRRPPNAYF